MFTEAPFDTSFHWMSGPRQITTLADASPYTPGSPMLRALMEDRSFFTCYESLQLAHGSGAGSAAGLRRQSRRAGARSRFLAERADASRSRMAPTDARVILNQNWAPGWTSTRRTDRAAEADGAGVGDDAARTKRPVHVHVPAASAGRGPGAVRRRADRHAAAVAAANRAYFFGSGGSATTIATASPFGDTASRVIAPS